MDAHFPVSDKHPRQAQIYGPALPRDRTLNVTDMRLPSNLYAGTERWRQYRNSYRNTVVWTVGSFFDKLFTRANLERTFIIYTSDHGQYLHERGGAGTTTHCNTVASVEEGTVPLVAIDAHGLWAEAAKRNFDASSHYRIFPTLLNAMGYDPSAVQRFYGEGLDSPLPDPSTFNGRFNARLGRKPEWIKVQRTSVARPPASDYTGRTTGKMR